MLTAEEIDAHLTLGEEPGRWWWNTGLFQILITTTVQGDYKGFLYLSLRATGAIHNVTLVEVQGYTRKDTLEKLASRITSFDWSEILGIGPMVEEWLEPPVGKRSALERVASEEDLV